MFMTLMRAASCIEHSQDLERHPKQTRLFFFFSFFFIPFFLLRDWGAACRGQQSAAITNSHQK